MLDDYEDTLARALARLESRTSFAELMAERSSGYMFSHERQTTEAAPRTPSQGVVLRAWNGDRWVESATVGLDSASVDRVVDDLSRQLPGHRAGSNPPGKSTTGHNSRSVEARKPVRDITVEERESVTKLWYGWATQVPGILNAQTHVQDLSNERLYLSTAGAFRYQLVTRVACAVAPVAIENGRVEYDFAYAGGVGGFEIVDRITEESVKDVANEAHRLLSAKLPPTGPTTVLMDPSTAGTFAHESFGHGTEADQMLRDRSYLKPLIGQVVAPEILTIADDGSLPGGWGSIFFDDEGHPTERTALIDHGRFAEVLHDRETAAALGGKPKGNARRANFLSRPFVRMTNTFVDPGSSTYDELVREARDGILLEHATSGIEDPLGGQMQIKVKKARRIEHGELTELYSSAALSGRVLDVLRAVRGVSGPTDFQMSPGTCGKGHSDQLPAGTGGTYLLSEAVVGPA